MRVDAEHQQSAEGEDAAREQEIAMYVPLTVEVQINQAPIVRRIADNPQHVRIVRSPGVVDHGFRARAVRTDDAGALLVELRGCRAGEYVSALEQHSLSCLGVGVDDRRPVAR